LYLTFSPAFLGGFFFYKKEVVNMHLTVIKNTDSAKAIQYKIARVVYAETLCSSLPAVEALVSMIENICSAHGREFREIAEDKTLFESLNESSERHGRLKDDCRSREFDMCLRVVQRMINGDLPDCCCGAVKFHRADKMPEWAVARGYIAEIDDLLFYL
jgi:hypothetical protein